jgi:hypothetical protein
LNPVKAKLDATAGDWPWSSAPAHLRREDDGLVTVRPLLDRVESFAEFLQMPADTERVAALTKASLKNDLAELYVQASAAGPIRRRMS